jgi:catechol 2,3-dioxygenase-like lactoylglutathione lyase family enzyme
VIAAIHHVGILGPDPVGSLAAFGQFTRGAIVADGDGAWLKGPNFLVRATRGPAPMAAAPVHAIGIAHVCVQMRDPAAARATLEAAGVAYIADPVSLGTGFHYCYARDAEHRLIELETAPFLQTDPSGWFAHVAFVSEDLPRILKFYAALLDLKVFPGGPFRNNPMLDQIAGLKGLDLEVGWLRARNLTLEFWRYNAPRLPADQRRQLGYSHIAFEVANFEAAVTRARDLGATEGDGVDLPSIGAMHALRDPDGNRIVFLAPDSAHAHLSVQALAVPGVVNHVLPARDAWAASRAS